MHYSKLITIFAAEFQVLLREGVRFNGYDGVIYYDNDISAPAKGETKEEYERRSESYRSDSSNQYDEGYEAGYEEGYEEDLNSR